MDGHQMQLQQIDYAPTLPNERRRRIIRRIALGLIALILIVLAIKSAPAAWRHVQILYWQHRAMTYTAPADKVVYDDNPAEAAKLSVADHSLIIATEGEAFDFPKPWELFYSLVSPPGRKPAATVFLHELVNPNGDRRLIAIALKSLEYPNGLRLECFQETVFEPGGLTRNPEEKLIETRDPEGSAVLRYQHNTKWYAGQPDPHDRSHFTIRGCRDGKPVTLNGWLRNDDLVEFEFVVD